MYSQLDVLRAYQLLSLAGKTELKQETAWRKPYSNILFSPAEGKRWSPSQSEVPYPQQLCCLQKGVSCLQSRECLLQTLVMLAHLLEACFSQSPL